MHEGILDTMKTVAKVMIILTALFSLGLFADNSDLLPVPLGIFEELCVFASLHALLFNRLSDRNIVQTTTVKNVRKGTIIAVVIREMVSKIIAVGLLLERTPNTDLFL